MNPEEIAQKLAAESAPSKSEVQLAPYINQIHDFFIELIDHPDFQSPETYLAIGSNTDESLLSISFAGNEIKFKRTDETIEVSFNSTKKNKCPNDKFSIIAGVLKSTESDVQTLDKALPTYIPFLLSY